MKSKRSFFPTGLLCLVALGLQLLAVPTAKAASFINTGSMSTNRYAHTATLLANGKVLVTGGVNGPFYLSSAELYDPATGIWTATGTMGAARSRHVATLLPNGKVLVTGGFNGGGLSSAELYCMTRLREHGRRPAR